MNKKTKNKIERILTATGALMIYFAVCVIVLIEFNIAQIPLMVSLYFATASAVITFAATYVGRKGDDK